MGILPDYQSLKTFGKPQLGHLLPQDCLLCGCNSPTLICIDCHRELPTLPQNRCPRCALPSSQGEVCGQCLRDPPSFDATRAAFRYDFPIDKLIQSFKYGQRLALAPFFGRLLAKIAHGLSIDLVLPLPLHTDRLKARGFNQALELARPVAQSLGSSLAPRLCTRIRDTAPQAELPWKARRQNVRHAFHCAANLGGSHVLLVDDVMTTGASLNECARTLKLHGAARVTLLVLARALRE